MNFFYWVNIEFIFIDLLDFLFNVGFESNCEVFWIINFFGFYYSNILGIFIWSLLWVKYSKKKKKMDFKFWNRKFCGNLIM